MIERRHAQTVVALSLEIQQPKLSDALRRFLYNQFHSDGFLFGEDVPLHECPEFDGPLNVHYSATATFYAPSDPCGAGGMRREHIRSTPSWFGGKSRFDCAFVKHYKTNTMASPPDIVRVLLFFSFTFRGVHFKCALIRSFEYISRDIDEDTGMHIVRPSSVSRNPFSISVISLDLIVRAAHLIPVFGTSFVPTHMRSHQSLNAFQAFYVNKFVDHHTFELLQ